MDSKQIRIYELLIFFFPVNEQMDKHQGLHLMRYGSKSKGYQRVKLFIFPPFNLEKEVLQSNLRTVRLLQREGGGVTFFLFFFLPFQQKKCKKKGRGSGEAEVTFHLLTSILQSASHVFTFPTCLSPRCSGKTIYLQKHLSFSFWLRASFDTSDTIGRGSSCRSRAALCEAHAVNSHSLRY